MTREVLQAIRRKRRAWKKYNVSHSNEDFAMYKQSVKKAKKMQSNAKKNFEKKLAKDSKANPKAFYSYVNSKKSNRYCIGPL